MVNALRSDWILKTDQGFQFLKKLSESDDMELFQSEPVKCMIMFLWQHYKPKLISFLFIPFLFYMTLFTVQFTIIPAYYVQVATVKEEDTFTNDVYFYIYKIAAFGVLPFLLYFMGYEWR
mmetsp:Transcript_19670/g.14401  ORF Transcript_19670/g.14401 Transcript_19670/m.14401 type:complete len:120 (+) Transcript_19670:398-757(+)